MQRTPDTTIKIESPARQRALFVASHCYNYAFLEPGTVLLRCDRGAFILCIRCMVKSQSSICASFVCSRIDLDGRGNNTFTAGIHPLPPTHLCPGVIEYRHLR
jgi:hypothetical protein